MRDVPQGVSITEGQTVWLLLSASNDRETTILRRQEQRPCQGHYSEPQSLSWNGWLTD